MNKESSASTARKTSSWHIAGWIMLGGLIGVALAAAFFAYGQPELLLEQLNLRYCG